MGDRNHAAAPEVAALGWAANSVITLVDGSDCPVQDLRPGMVVSSYSIKTRSISHATLEWIARVPTGVVGAIQLGERGLAQLTPNQPVVDFGACPSPTYKWAHQMGKAADCETDYVYNMVLQQNHHVISDGVICVTMGHGLTAAVVAQNGFMGRSVVSRTSVGKKELVAQLGLVQEEDMAACFDVDLTQLRRMVLAYGRGKAAPPGQACIDIFKYGAYNDNFPLQCVRITCKRLEEAAVAVAVAARRT